MKFKTTIRIITDAKDKNEAMEIAGEFLSGNISSGVDMHMRTMLVRSAATRAGLIGLFACIAILFSISLSGPNYCRIPAIGISGDGAIQPPLKTSAYESMNSDFKKEWQKEHTKEILNSIKG